MRRDHAELGRALTDAEADEYNEAYKHGADLLSRHINLHDRDPAPSPAREAEVREGIRLLERAAAILPASWPAHWLVGKGYQALGDHPRAYEAFRRAAGLDRGNA